LFSPALGSLALPVIPSSFRPMTDQGFFQPLPLCHLLVCAVVVCYFDSLDSKLAPQPVAFYAVVFFLVNATYVCLIWELISRSRGFADRGRHHALSIGHHLIPFWNCRHCSAEISTGWTWNLHLLPDRLSEARSARIGEVKNLTEDAGAAEAARSFVDLSALRRDPAPFWPLSLLRKELLQKQRLSAARQLTRRSKAWALAGQREEASADGHGRQRIHLLTLSKK
jgi:hypothetical protein